MAAQPGAESTVSLPEKRPSIPALTGLRAAAAWLVWLRHNELLPNQPAFLSRLSLEGSVGVSVFFVLSGFLIALRYLDEARLERGWFRGYLTNRFARIYPVYFAVTLVALVVFRARPLEWFTSLTLTGGFVHPWMLVVGPAWSLAVEECFYATAPLLFFAMRRGFVRGFVLPLGLAYAFVAVLLLFGQPSHDFTRFVVRHTFPGRFLEFLLGAWAALLLLRGRLRARSGLLTYGGLLAFAGGLLVLILRQEPGIPAHRAEGFGLNVLFSLTVLPWATVMLIIGLSLEVTWVSRFLAHPVMVLCGRGSYVFYLVHMGFLAGVLAKYLHLHYAFQFVAMNLISVAAFWFYEEPIRNFITTYARNRRARLASA